MTLDQARAHMRNLRNLKVGHAASLRKLGEDYKRAANAADDPELRRTHFEASSRLFGDARELDQDVEAIDRILAERMAT